MKKIWFNRWFSVAFHYMNMIRDNADGEKFIVYATHPDIRHMSLQGADVKEQEPELPDDEYVDYCLDFCKRNSIDVFVPRLKMYAIVNRQSEFKEIGTVLLACTDTELLGKLVNKALFYEDIREKNIVKIPDYATARNATEFRTAYEQISSSGAKVCFKPTEGEGGLGFRIIDNERNQLQDMFGVINNKISFSEAHRIISTQDEIRELMVMELLDGYEYSIDCLSDRDGNLLAAVPRRKAGGRLRLLDNVAELQEIASRIALHYRIPFTFNIQVKYRDGVPKLLEINPRMSGGLHITCLCGINFPYYAVQLALGRKVHIPEPQFDILACHVEKPVVINF